MANELMNYKVYVHISPDVKYYVGITKQKPNRRWRKGKGYSHNDYFDNAITKHGWDNFQHEIIASGITLEEANNFEQILIKTLRSNEREFGYNLTDGGDGVLGTKCPEWKKEEQRKKMVGKGNHMYGISLEGMSGKDNPMYGVPSPNRKKVQCITTGEIFDTITSAGEYYDTHRSVIRKNIDGKKPYAGILNGEPLLWRDV
jgi:group I intron endonuclease